MHELDYIYYLERSFCLCTFCGLGLEHNVATGKLNDVLWHQQEH